MEATNGHHELSPVLAGSEARVIEPAQQPQLTAPVVAAAGGAVVGAVAYMLLRVLRRPARRRGQVRLGGRRRGRGYEITGSRSFLVDVHMIKR
jgi:peptidoglycan/LPS O-acetylase OafA/YrhL